MRIGILILAIILTSCYNTNNQPDLREANLQLTSRYFNEVYNQNRLDLIDSLFVADYEHTNTEGKTFTGREELKAAVQRIEKLLPSLKLEIVEAVPDTEKVMFLIRMQSNLPNMASVHTKATHTDFNETFIFWVKDGKIYKGQSVGAHLPFIKQVSGFEGGLMDVIKALEVKSDSLSLE